MDYFWLKPSANLLENFDVELQDFYLEALSKEMNISKKDSIYKIRKGMQDVVNAYRKETVNAYSSSIAFDSASKRCAYVLKHCPGFTSAVARHFRQLLERNPGILWEPLSQRRLNICCLGGGPASDAVAISRVVNSIQSWFWIRDPRALEFHVSVVDLNGGWKSTARNVLLTLEETPKFFDSEKMSLSFQFCTADLTQPLNEEVSNAVQNADIITMVYFLSAVNGSKVKDKSPEMIKQILKNLKTGALLFYLDSSKDLHYEGIISTVKNSEDLKQIYGPEIRELHTLSIKSIKRYFKIYSKLFKTYLCLTNCFLTVSIWQKTTDCNLKQRGESDHQSILDKNYKRNSFHKKMSYKTLKMKNFRDKLHRLIMLEFQQNFFVEDIEELDEDYQESNVSQTNFKMFYPTKSKRKRIYSESQLV